MSQLPTTQIIILGGGGDLSRKKLLPALFDLYTRDMLPPEFHILGVARTPRTSEEYRELARESLAKYARPKENKHHSLDDFCENLTYLTGSVEETSTYSELLTTLEEMDTAQNRTSNRLFYLALPPKLYKQVFSDLRESGLAEEKNGQRNYLLVEKPFGDNLVTAQELDHQLASLYEEKQIFRIDHYLAKEAVQNILSFRFANGVFTAPWNKDHIESVTITMTETIDVGERTAFYEEVGALRDVGQNHLLQLVALTAMREPTEFTAQAIREARTEVLRALKPIGSHNLHSSILRAQYDGYRDPDDVSDDSKTETYFELKTEIDLPEWEGVPFYIKAGKALDTAEVSITVKFKDMANNIFDTANIPDIENIIKLTISPEQIISITLYAKAPGLGFHLEPRELSFVCEKGDIEIKNSYEKVIYDALIGDNTLFTRSEEVQAAWEFITPIIESWEALPLHHYKKGSRGPEQTIIC